MGRTVLRVGFIVPDALDVLDLPLLAVLAVGAADLCVKHLVVLGWIAWVLKNYVFCPMMDLNMFWGSLGFIVGVLRCSGSSLRDLSCRLCYVSKMLPARRREHRFQLSQSGSFLQADQAKVLVQGCVQLFFFFFAAWKLEASGRAAGLHAFWRRRRCPLRCRASWTPPRWMTWTRRSFRRAAARGDK